MKDKKTMKRFFLALLLVIFPFFSSGVFVSASAHATPVTYSILVVIAEHYHLPEGGTVYLDDASRAIALETANALDTRILEYSDGAADMVVTVRTIESIEAWQYNEATGLAGAFINPLHVRSAISDASEYDFIAVISDSDATSAVWQSDTLGATPEIDGTGFWVAAVPDAPNIAIHELAHIFELRFSAQGYTGLPQCGDSYGSGIHCAEEYGYSSNNDPCWLDDYYSADLPDGTGLNHTVWNVS